MKRFTQAVIANDESALLTVQEYLYDHMRQLGYAPVAGTERYEGSAPNFKVVILGREHNDAESIKYTTYSGDIEWM